MRLFNAYALLECAAIVFIMSGLCRGGTLCSLQRCTGKGSSGSWLRKSSCHYTDTHKSASGVMNL